jgi:hypothetical protein
MSVMDNPKVPRIVKTLYLIFIAFPASLWLEEDVMSGPEPATERPSHEDPPCRRGRLGCDGVTKQQGREIHDPQPTGPTAMPRFASMRPP